MDLEIRDSPKSLFLWKVTWRCLLTRSFLITRGLDVPSLYLGCREDGETMVHVIFLCPWACQVRWLVSLDGFFMHAEGQVNTFLELLRLSSRHCSLKALRTLAYIAYHI